MAGYIGNEPLNEATQTRESFTATSGQTSFATSGYTPGYLDVYFNGVHLETTDYTATNGSDVVLAVAAAANDILTVVAWKVFNPTNLSVSDITDLTATATELNYCDGVTSNIQTQIDNIDPLPSQSGQSGNFLTTDGSTASWTAISTGTSTEHGWENAATITTDYTITTNYNMMSAGPISITTGSVTVPSGSTWTIV